MYGGGFTHILNTATGMHMQYYSGLSTLWYIGLCPLFGVCPLLGCFGVITSHFLYMYV